MGLLVDAEVNRGNDAADESVLIPADDPVVYQLVRVEGDGKLVPATDDEVIEVEHLIENDKNELPSVEGPCHSEGCISSEVLSSKKPDLESSEGLCQSENIVINSRKLNARLEYIEVMLQKVKEEERSRLSCESHHSFSKYIDVDGIQADHFENSLVCGEKLQSENALVESDTQPTSLNVSEVDQSQGVVTCPEASIDPCTSGLSISELPESLKAKISMLKGEFCLDNLTIRELQEVFRVTFGRETNVKDKMWLKRRLAMGLSNSYDHHVANFALKEKVVVHGEEKEVSLCLLRSSIQSGSLSMDQDKRSQNDRYFESLTSPIKQMKDHQAFSGKRPRRSVVECDALHEYLHAEQIAAKRVRKPTRRYIEELSEVETGECIDPLCYSVKDLEHGQSSPIPRIRSMQNIGSQGNTFVTRQDSLGGFHIQIPYVSRVRRGRPRKNFANLMNVVCMNNETNFIVTPNPKEEQDQKNRKMDSFGDVSDESADAMRALRPVARRKHHRAWTLTEVMKLVEGVARYGTGRWSEIKRISFASHAYRTSVDLKDKWRNLLKASFAQGPAEKGVRKHASTAMPRSILLRVRELAEIHTQPGVEFGHIKFASHGGKDVQEKSSGFL